MTLAMDRMTRLRAPGRGALTHAAALLALSLPMVVFLVLIANPRFDVTWGDGTSHFYVVSLAAAVAFALALAVIRAARTLPDARTFFLAMAFVSMSMSFLAHGLGTSPWFGGHAAHEPGAAALAAPGSDDGYGYGEPAAHSGHDGAITTGAVSRQAELRLVVVGYSARLSLFAGAFFLALSVANIGARASAVVVRWYWPLIALGVLLFAAHAVVALVRPGIIVRVPLESPAVSWSVAVVAWSFLAFAALRYSQAYRFGLLPLQGAMLAGAVLLAEAQYMMIAGETWRLSWWAYHVAMLAGFGWPALALLHQYRRTGDIGALIEGLFLRQQVLDLRAGDPQALAALAAAIAAKDGETAGHLERVGQLSVAIGIELGLPHERIAVLRWGGRLHDLGKIGVPNSILRKPGALTREETAIMQGHTLRGWHVARRCRQLEAAAPIIRWHHEKVDGSGYPDGLRGDEIPLEARIVAVADVWDALTSVRPYKRAWSEAEVTELMRRDSGTHFDPVCVEALFRVLGLQPAARAA